MKDEFEWRNEVIQSFAKLQLKLHHAQLMALFSFLMALSAVVLGVMK